MLGKIKQEEVRVGNIVKLAPHTQNLIGLIPKLGVQRGPYYEITAAGIYHIHLHGSWCDPVALDERWLDVFGFEQQDFLCKDNSVMCGVWVKDSILLQEGVVTRGYILCFIEPLNPKNVNFITNIEFVYELQNGFHFIKNKGIEINLKKLTHYFGANHEQK